MAAQPSSPDPLSLIEAQLQDLQAALVASDALNFEQGAQALRQAAMGLAALQGLSHDAQAAARIERLARQLLQLRDQLARVLALTQAQAATLLPPAETVTYGPSSAAGGARIYRAPG